jgi:ribA/ribD-fused uncharacterized protein
MISPIISFTKEHAFLSNFYSSPVVYDFTIWPTVEHAYQAAKSEDYTVRQKIYNSLSPGVAKRIGREVKLRSDWESVKLSIMEMLLRDKFAVDCSLAVKLDKTGDAELIEGNYWGDRFWGQCPVGQGENHLGRLLMKIRLDNRIKGL